MSFHSSFSSLILPVYNIALSFSSLAGVGGSLISRLLGRKELKEASKVSGFSIMLGVGMAFMFSISMLLFMHPILNLLGASADIYEYARQYSFCVVVLGAIPTVLSNFFVHTFNSFGKGDKALFLGIMRWSAFNIPMLFIMDYLVGRNGIVWSQLLADILTVSLSLYVYFSFEKKYLKGV